MDEWESELIQWMEQISQTPMFDEFPLLPVLMNSNLKFLIPFQAMKTLMEWSWNGISNEISAEILMPIKCGSNLSFIKFTSSQEEENRLIKATIELIISTRFWHNIIPLGMNKWEEEWSLKNVRTKNPFEKKNRNHKSFIRKFWLKCFTNVVIHEHVSFKIEEELVN